MRLWKAQIWLFHQQGQTLYELAARVGVPTIAVGVVDNQINNIQNWQKQGFIEFAGFWDDDNLEENILAKLELLKRFCF